MNMLLKSTSGAVRPIQDMIFAPQHFFPSSNRDEAMLLFKSSVTSVNIAISSYCNRKCWYCPNTQTTSSEKKIRIADRTFSKIINQLKEINFSGEFTLNRYNEPLAERKYVISRIIEIRKKLSESKITIFTNGDYLTKQYIEELGYAGVDKVIATAHTNHKTDTPELRLNRLEKHLKRIDIPYQFTYDNPLRGVRTAELDCKKYGISEFIFSVYFFGERNNSGVVIMSDRGGSLSIDKGYQRISPCWTAFTQLNIEYDGRLLPCCEINPDAFNHENYILGRLSEADDDIYLSWCNMKHALWRRKSFHYGPKEPPCTSCTIGQASDSDELRNIVSKWRNVLDI